MNFLKLLSLLLSIALLVGCGSTPTESGSSGQESNASESTSLSQFTEDPLMEEAILNIGNPYRLQQKIRAAQNGEDITIAYIGGSITEGPDVKYAQRYVTLTSQEFETTYCNGGKVTAINAGLSGTPSNLGVLRLQRDVLSHHPDIVFVEFAVNDGQDLQQKLCFESMIRTILEQENAPAVVLLFNRTEDGYSCQSLMGLTGLYYSLPMVSINDAISARMERGELTWKEFSDDSVHPNAYGHRLTADFIAYLFSKVAAGTWQDYAVPTQSQYGAPYRNAVMITPDSESTAGVTIQTLGGFTQFRGNRTGFPCQWRAGEGEGLRFTVEANAVFLIYHRNKTANMGAVDVFINGEKAMTINACDPDGWGDPWSKLLIRSKTVETYEIEIRPAEGSEDKLFDIFGIAYTQNP